MNGLGLKPSLPPLISAQQAIASFTELNHDKLFQVPQRMTCDFESNSECVIHIKQFVTWRPLVFSGGVRKRAGQTASLVHPICGGTGSGVFDGTGC